MNKKHNKGFTLMVALLVNAIIMVIGLGISTIVLREFNLSIVSRESQNAFYAADTLVECMLYWDIKGGMFRSGLPVDLEDLVCDQVEPKGTDPLRLVTIDLDLKESGFSDCSPPPVIKPGREEFTYSLRSPMLMESFPGGRNIPSADSTITRTESCREGSVDSFTTAIDTSGYNTSRADDTRRVERGLFLRY